MNLRREPVVPAGYELYEEYRYFYLYKSVNVSDRWLASTWAGTHVFRGSWPEELKAAIDNYYDGSAAL